MDGFHAVGEAGARPYCLNLLNREWTLDGRAKFALACLGVAAAGVLAEALTLARGRAHAALKRADAAAARPPTPGAARDDARRRARAWRAALVALHGVQLLLGYLLMLVAMTYSVELLLCTCAGLAAGCADRAARAEPSLRILGLSESSAPRSPLAPSQVRALQSRRGAARQRRPVLRVQGRRR